MQAHELVKAVPDSHQVEAALDSIAEAELTRRRGYRLDGESHRIEMEPGVVAVHLASDAERIACVHGAPDDRLGEV